ncbi:hypothetical protein ACIQJX_26320 [Streptomyces griseoviridis]
MHVFQVAFVPDPLTAADMRGSTAAFLQRARLAGPMTDNMVLVVSAFIANAIEYRPGICRGGAGSRCSARADGAPKALMEAADQHAARSGLPHCPGLFGLGCVGAARMRTPEAVVIALILLPMAWLVLCGKRVSGPGATGTEPSQ